MLNIVTLVGRVVEKPEKKETINGDSFVVLNLAVARPFKNENGEIDTDFVKVLLWNAIADSAAEFCTKGSVMGVKGRIQTRNVEAKIKNETVKLFQTDIIGERLSFIQMKKEVVEVLKDHELEGEIVVSEEKNK